MTGPLHFPAKSTSLCYTVALLVKLSSLQAFNNLFSRFLIEKKKKKSFARYMTLTATDMSCCVMEHCLARLIINLNHRNKVING